MRVNYAACSFAAVLSFLPAGAVAEEQYPWFPEAYPPHLSARLVQQDEVLQVRSLSSAERWFIDKAKRWDVDSPIKVCFFGGNKPLRVKVAAIANQWSTIAGTLVPLDFGDPASPRICKANEFNHIRVGYRYIGYWSLVGLDSIEQAPQGEQSMNLGRYDSTPPPEPTFTRVILHEFGHAIGFHHEHQNPVGPCQNDFNWDVIRTYLKGSPNFWSDETIDFNMKSGAAEAAPGPFDVKSIMLYSFPKAFYKQGASADCFTADNVSLSDGDRSGLAALYPADRIQSAAIKNEALVRYATILNSKPAIAPVDRSLAISRVGQQSAAGRSKALESFWAVESFGGQNAARALDWTAAPPRM